MSDFETVIKVLCMLVALFIGISLGERIGR